MTNTEERVIPVDPDEVGRIPESKELFFRFIMKTYYVYILTNITNKVLYIGVTNDLIRRVYEHKYGLVDGFTKKYNCHKLVWYESTSDINSAIKKEKQMKKWKRVYKENLINKMNPEWTDLYDELV
jgi:putative endonuclease